MREATGGDVGGGEVELLCKTDGITTLIRFTMKSVDFQCNFSLFTLYFLVDLHCTKALFVGSSLRSPLSFFWSRMEQQISRSN